MFTFLYENFIQDNMYQILSQLVSISKTLWCVFSVHSVYAFYVDQGVQNQTEESLGRMCILL